MSNGEVLIEVCQLSFRGAKYDGKWYVYRGKGLGGKYLHRDGKWYSSTNAEGFWDSPEEAEEVAEFARRYARVYEDPAPPP